MSRTSDDQPIWARPEPGGRRPRLTREQIARTALEIADREGFDAVSMRHVAATLNTGAMTLYNYVRTKDELVALMHDELMAQVLVPGELPDSWRGALTLIAHRTHDVMARHPWALNSLQEAQFGPNAMRHFEQTLAALARTGIDTPAKFSVLTLVDDYVRGAVLRASEIRKRKSTADADPAAVQAAIEFGMAQLRTGEFPHTAALLGGDLSSFPEDAPSPAMAEDGLREQFERGLRAVLDGAAAEFGLT
ncbi:TetR/AcrR family transcriptional regulator [Actinocrispum sp. NPDC049592]|uniref:TetR/AcrR family transcriptional regulator n=1 Tax=Actinocrispum sp. NPDC049592 TaxID=3154835 RepID=UPI00342F9C52